MPLNTAETVIKVSPESNVKKVAGAIAYCLDNSDDSTAVMHAIGAGAVNQAVKSIAVSRGMVATRGKDVWCRIGFSTVAHDQDKDRDVSVIVFNLSAK